MTSNTSFSLDNENFHIAISTHGAELQSIFDKKKQLELLWQGDAAYWARRAPVLFPIVGRLVNDTLKYRQNTYPMKQHGFARDLDFDVIYAEDNQLEFRLLSTEAIKKQYPFDFEFIIAYLLMENVLTINYVVRNMGNEILPFSVGGHPAFNWPLIPGKDKQAHSIESTCDAMAHMYQLNGGLLKPDKIPSPVKNQRFQLKDELFEHDAMIFDGIVNREVTYNADDEYQIKIKFADFPQFGLWTKPGAPFICLEPWYGFASPEDFDDDIRKKPGIMLLPENSEVQLAYSMEFISK